MNTHRLITQKWKPLKKYDFRDCRFPLRFPLEDKTKIIIKSPHKPSYFKDKTEFEQSVIMERFMDKLQMILDQSEVIKGFKKQEFLMDLEEKSYSKELTDKMKVLNDNIMRYKIPREQAEKLRNELLKDIMIKEKSTQILSQISATNNLNQSVNRLGSIVQNQQMQQTPQTQITHEDVDEHVDDLIAQAEADTGVTIPDQTKTNMHEGIMRSTAPKIINQIVNDLDSPIRQSRNPRGVVLVQRTVLYGRWNSLRGIINRVGEQKPSREEIESLSNNILNDWFYKLLDTTDEKINLIYKKHNRTNSTFIALNDEIDLLKNAMQIERQNFDGSLPQQLNYDDEQMQPVSAPIDLDTPQVKTTPRAKSTASIPVSKSPKRRVIKSKRRGIKKT